MTMLTRRMVLATAIAAMMATGLPPTPAIARKGDWIEVVGSAATTGPADRDAARRRALADALLSAALAGGAMVRGHSVMSNMRLTSDLLVVRPVGSVLAHQVLSEDFDGHLWRIRIRAQVGQPSASTCGDRRQMFVTMYPPRVRVSPSAPAWTAALANDLGFRLAELAEADPAVARLTRANRLPNADPARDRGNYLVLTSGNVRAGAGGHGLFTDIAIEPAGRDLTLSLALRLDGPAGERIEKSHQAAVRLAGVSALGRAAVLAERDRATLTQHLAGGVRPALSALLHEAGCRPVLARLDMSGGKLVVPVGRAHGVKRTNLAFTVDEDASTEMLEVVKLAEHSAMLAPIDPARNVASLAGRPVRFLDTLERLW
jgi:hypothetical protein